MEQQKLLLAVGVEIDHQGSWDVLHLYYLSYHKPVKALPLLDRVRVLEALAGYMCPKYILFRESTSTNLSKTQHFKSLRGAAEGDCCTSVRIKGGGFD